MPTRIPGCGRREKAIVQSPFRRRRRSVVVLAASLALFGAQASRADTAVCSGKLTKLANHANGGNGLYVVVGDSTIIRVCSFTASQFTVTPDDCKHMASVAALAYATGDTVTFYIDNAPSTVCSAVPGWFVANTRYFAVSKQ